MPNPDINASNIATGNLSFDPAEDSAQYVTGQFVISPELARDLIANLGSNSSTNRAARDVVSRAILEAIEASNVNP